MRPKRRRICRAISTIANLLWVRGMWEAYHRQFTMGNLTIANSVITGRPQRHVGSFRPAAYALSPYVEVDRIWPNYRPWSELICGNADFGPQRGTRRPRQQARNTPEVFPIVPAPLCYSNFWFLIAMRASRAIASIRRTGAGARLQAPGEVARCHSCTSMA